MQDLRISLVQGDTRWHDPAANRAYYGALLAPLAGTTDLVILPETFTSGFSNEAIAQAEGMDGPTVAWVREQAKALNAAVIGSVQLREGEGVYNRLLFATPDGALQYYDKRHLFRYGGEHERYAAGRERLSVEWKGWRINPQVCYDLRFPVFSATVTTLNVHSSWISTCRSSSPTGRRHVPMRGRHCCVHVRSRICASLPR